MPPTHRTDAPRPTTVALIGAGLAGAACARALADAGFAVQVFDKSRGVGGRMATRRTEWTGPDGIAIPARFDHGAPAFEARSEAFIQFVEAAEREGLLARWVPVIDRDGQTGQATAPQWVPTPDAPSLCRSLLKDLPVKTGCTVDMLRREPDGWVLESAGALVAQGVDRVVVAIPPAQAAALLASHRPDWAERARAVEMVPCWTMMAVTDAPAADLPAWDLAEPAADPIGLIVRSDARPGRTRVPGRAHWVVHASDTWSRAHLEDPPADVLARLQDALAQKLGAPLAWHHAAVHRWRYAHAPAEATDAAVPELCDWDPARGLGACGDALGGAGVEGAWRSGRALAGRLIEQHRQTRPA
jgi:predicted NAD/FAD-dependent oxidoreductase